MSTNGTNSCEDAEMADCDGEKVVTMMDVLKEQEDFEEDANAVLGASDDKNCTYSKGYVKRQAIYACMTCTDAKNDSTKRAGVCLACSLMCHENHELIELYTKRNFRCDCGNPKFNSHPCQFTPDKTDLNIENIYNQNFSGVYCTCHRPYPDPDPESNTDGDMIQCIICEDWLHFNHLDAVVPSNEQYSEMICKACMDKNEFLHDYSDLTINKESIDVDVVGTSSTTNINCDENSTIEKADNKENDNSNIDNIESAQTKNDTITQGTNNENVINKEGQTSTEAEASEGNEEKVETTESAPTNSSEENVCKLETGTKTEMEQTEAHPGDVKPLAEPSNENLDEKQSSLIKEGDTGNTERPDNRSQEQVEEDMLLADPMDTDVNQKTEAMDVVNSNEIQPSTNNSVDIKSNIDTEISGSEPKVEDAAAGDSDTTNTTTNEDKVSVSETKQSEDVAPTEISEGVKTESTAIINNTEDISTANQPDISPTPEQPKIATSEELETASTDKLDNESTNEQLDRVDKINTEKDVSVNENNIVSEGNSNSKKENSADIVMDENNANDAPSDNIEKYKIESDSNCDNKLSDKSMETDILKRKFSSDGDIEDVGVKKAKLEGNTCVRPKGVKKVHNGATFWPSSFRHKLCTCNECLSMYKDLSVLFLIDPDDTVIAYEQLGKERTDGKPASQYEKGMAALSSLGHVQQINALTEYAKLRDKLLDFLKTFKDKKVIVKEEDIKAFFAGMKPVREPDGVYFCR